MPPVLVSLPSLAHLAEDFTATGVWMGGWGDRGCSAKHTLQFRHLCPPDPALLGTPGRDVADVHVGVLPTQGDQGNVLDAAEWADGGVQGPSSRGCHYTAVDLHACFLQGIEGVTRWCKYVSSKGIDGRVLAAVGDSTRP